MSLVGGLSLHLLSRILAKTELGRQKTGQGRQGQGLVEKVQRNLSKV